MHKTVAEDNRQAELLWSRVELLGWSRREFLILLGSGAVVATLAACESQTPSPPSSQTTASLSKPTELIYLSATTLAQAIRKKKVSCGYHLYLTEGL